MAEKIIHHFLCKNLYESFSERFKERCDKTFLLFKQSYPEDNDKCVFYFRLHKLKGKKENYFAIDINKANGERAIFKKEFDKKSENLIVEWIYISRNHQEYDNYVKNLY